MYFYCKKKGGGRKPAEQLLSVRREPQPTITLLTDNNNLRLIVQEKV